LIIGYRNIENPGDLPGLDVNILYYNVLRHTLYHNNAV